MQTLLKWLCCTGYILGNVSVGWCEGLQYGCPFLGEQVLAQKPLPWPGWDLWKVPGPWSQPRDWMHNLDQGSFWRTGGILKACEARFQQYDICEMRTQQRDIYCHVTAAGWCGRRGSQGQILPHTGCCHPLQRQEPSWLSPSCRPRPLALSCLQGAEPADGSSSCPRPPKGAWRVWGHSLKGSHGPGNHCALLTANWERAKGTVRPSRAFPPLRQGLGSGRVQDAGPQQACWERPCLEIYPASAPSTLVPLAHAPQEHRAAGESWCSDGTVIKKRQEN